HLLPRQPAQRHVLADLGPNPRQRIGEGYNMLILGAVAHLAEARVIAILLAPPGVTSGRLDMSVSERTDPDIGPGRRDRQRLDATHDARIADSGAVRTEKDEALAGSPATQP